MMMMMMMMKVNFAVPIDHKRKMKEIEKLDKYLDLARELKKLRKIKVAMTPFVVGQSPRTWKRHSMNWGLKEKLKSSRLQHY